MFGAATHPLAVSFVTTALQLRHGGLGITHPCRANAFEESVIAGFAAGDGLVMHVSRRFWNSEERFRQDVYEGEQRLLPYPQIANFSGHALQTRSETLFCRVDTAFPASPRSIAARMNALWHENPPYYVAASIRLLKLCVNRRPWVIAFCFRTIAMGASLCRCGDGPYVTPGSPLHNVQQNRLNRCTLKVVMIQLLVPNPQSNVLHFLYVPLPLFSAFAGCLKLGTLVNN